MKLILVRSVYTPTSTIGDILVDHKVFCHTLEDVVRKPGSKKIPGMTAIKRGCYNLSLMFSKKFKRVLPLIQNVPDFEGIRMHGGNTSADTAGCVIVAHKIVSDTRVQDSAEAAVIELLSGHTGQHFIEIFDTSPYWGI